MDRKLNLSKLSPHDFLRFYQSEDSIEAVVLDDTKGGVCITGADGVFDEADWSEYKGFYFDMRQCVSQCYFWDDVLANRQEYA